MTILHSDFATIAALDLDPIKAKLMHKESGESWTLEQTNAIETEYRRFLYLMKKFPNELAAPRFDVDIFWHYHILDTRKYAHDCDAVFGYFLHHFPYLGLRGEEDLEAHQRIGQRTRELYEETFSEPYGVAAVPSEQNVMEAVAGDGRHRTSAAGKIAFSVRAPAMVAASQSAFSVRAPASIMTPQTAFSVRAPAEFGTSQTAFSVRAPASVATPQTAFSVRAPAEFGASQTAFSVRQPDSELAARPVEPDDEQVRQLTAFFSVRPGVATAATRQ
jgi:hypothetical protein